jgi:hypothetical protein
MGTPGRPDDRLRETHRLSEMPPPRRWVSLRSTHPTGYPYEDYAEAVEFIATVPIADSDRRKISFGNAKALYKL